MAAAISVSLSISSLKIFANFNICGTRRVAKGGGGEGEDSPLPDLNKSSLP